MDFLGKIFFLLFSILLFFSCGENFFGVDEKKEFDSFENILVDPRNKNFLNRLIEAIGKSEKADVYYEQLLERLGPEFYEQFAQDFDSTNGMLSAFDKMPVVGDKVDEVLDRKYETAKRNLNDSPSAIKEFRNATIYSISSKVKRSFYTEDNKFSTDKGQENLSEQEASEIVERMEEYDDLSTQKLFTGVTEQEGAEEKTDKEKVMDFFSEPGNRPPSSID